MNNNKLDLDIITPTKFSLLIEQIVQTKRISYMDACLLYCEENNVEPESLGRLVNKALKQKIQFEAENLHFLQKSSTLPL